MAKCIIFYYQPEIEKSRFLDDTNMDISDVFKNAKQQDQLGVLKSFLCLFTNVGFDGHSKV